MRERYEQDADTHSCMAGTTRRHNLSNIRVSHNILSENSPFRAPRPGHSSTRTSNALLYPSQGSPIGHARSWRYEPEGQGSGAGSTGQKQREPGEGEWREGEEEAPGAQYRETRERRRRRGVAGVGLGKQEVASSAVASRDAR